MAPGRTGMDRTRQGRRFPHRAVCSRTVAALIVPPPLRDKLGDEASAALLDLLHEARNGQRELLLQSVEDRFLRHVAESEGRLRSEMQAGFLDLQRQMGGLRTDFSKETTDIRKEIGEVRKEITTQTRWILTVMVGAAVLIPTLQRVMAWLFP